MSIKDSTTLFSASMFDLSTVCFFAQFCSPLLDDDIVVGRGLFFIGRVLFDTPVKLRSIVSVADLSPEEFFIWFETFVLSFDAVMHLFGTNRRSSPTRSFPSRMGRKQSKSSLICPEELPSLQLWVSFFSRLSFLEFKGLSPLVAHESLSAPRERVLIEEVTSHHIVERSSFMRQTLQVGIRRLGLLFEA